MNFSMKRVNPMNILIALSVEGIMLLKKSVAYAENSLSYLNVWSVVTRTINCWKKEFYLMVSQNAILTYS